MKLVDTNLDMNLQARLVLAALAEEDLLDSGVDGRILKALTLRTTAFYNGRERGFVLMVGSHFSAQRINVFVAENRNSDHIALLWWVGEADINPPTLAEVPASAWDRRVLVPHMAIRKAIEELHVILSRFIDQNEEVLSGKLKGKVKVTVPAEG